MMTQLRNRVCAQENTEKKTIFPLKDNSLVESSVTKSRHLLSILFRTFKTTEQSELTFWPEESCNRRGRSCSERQNVTISTASDGRDTTDI